MFKHSNSAAFVTDISLDSNAYQSIPSVYNHMAFIKYLKVQFSMSAFIFHHCDALFFPRTRKNVQVKFSFVLRIFKSKFFVPNVDTMRLLVSKLNCACSISALRTQRNFAMSSNSVNLCGVCKVQPTLDDERLICSPQVTLSS